MLKYIKILKAMVTDESQWWRYVRATPVLRFIPDKYYLKKWYKFKTGKELNLKNPQSFNEKLQWLKLYDRNPNYSKMVDKYEVRKYIKEKIGEEHLIPLVGGPWKNFEDIDFAKLPDQFVLKCTHDSGSVEICKNKKEFDIEKVRKKFNYTLKRNYYYYGREWPYKNVKPRIIAEKYLLDDSGIEPKDYKIFNFNGEPRIIQVDLDRFVNHRHNYYTTKWEFLDVYIDDPNDPNVIIECPPELDELLRLARRLSKGIPHLRTDFYIMKGKILFGELTFYHAGGMGKFTPSKFERQMGDWLTLPNKR